MIPPDLLSRRWTIIITCPEWKRLGIHVETYPGDPHTHYYAFRCHDLIVAYLKRHPEVKWDVKRYCDILTLAEQEAKHE